MANITKEALCSYCRGEGNCVASSNIEYAGIGVATGFKTPEQGQAIVRGWRSIAKDRGCTQLPAEQSIEEGIREALVQATLAGD